MEVQEQVLGGRYKLLNELGSGGTAVVWRARDEVLGRPVAVKLLAGRFAEDPDSRLRIRDEARAAATLSPHPHIAQVYDFGESSVGGCPMPYVVMELVNGPTLQQRVAAGPIPPRTAFRICGEVASALAAAHADGLVHRDIKPANVMVTPGGAKVVDFGIAAAAGPREPEEVLLGTPAYLAPERLTGGAVVPATDVYALGVLLYRLLANEAPWSVDTTTQMLSAHIYLEPTPLPELPGVPPAVTALVDRCLRKTPADRPSAAEACAILADAAEASKDLVRPDAAPLPVPAASDAAATGPAAANRAGPTGDAATGAGAAGKADGLRDGAAASGAAAPHRQGASGSADSAPSKDSSASKDAAGGSTGAPDWVAAGSAGGAGAASAGGGRVATAPGRAQSPPGRIPAPRDGRSGGGRPVSRDGRKAAPVPDRARRKRRAALAGGAVAAAVVAALLVWFFAPVGAGREKSDGTAPPPPAVARQQSAQANLPGTTTGENQPGGDPARGGGAVTPGAAPPPAGGVQPDGQPTGAPTNPDPGGGATGPAAPQPTTNPPASSAPPSGGRTKTLTSAGGSVVARCSGGKATLISWNPASGYDVEKVNAGPGLTTAIVFKSTLSRIRMTVTCVAGVPATVNLPL